jgi:kynurenine formamidase
MRGDNGVRRVINLTIPFYPFMPVGNVWPQDPSFRPRPIMTHGEQGVRVDYLAVHSESGTRIMTKATYDPKFPKIGEIDLGQLVDMSTVVVDIPKNAGEEITAADIDERIAADPEYQDGDAILIRTGWGDGERFRKMGDAYTTTTPHFSDAGATRLAEVMRERKTSLFGIDVAYIGNLAPYHMRPEWVDLPPWLRPPFPSEQARTYMRHYTPDKGLKDWSASRPLHGVGSVLAALCNTGNIRTKRVLLTALPLYIEKAPGAPITVVAVEDGATQG